MWGPAYSLKDGKELRRGLYIIFMLYIHTYVDRYTHIYTVDEHIRSTCSPVHTPSVPCARDVDLIRHVGGDAQHTRLLGAHIAQVRFVYYMELVLQAWWRGQRVRDGRSAVCVYSMPTVRHGAPCPASVHLRMWSTTYVFATRLRKTITDCRGRYKGSQ